MMLVIKKSFKGYTGGVYTCTLQNWSIFYYISCTRCFDQSKLPFDILGGPAIFQYQYLYYIEVYCIDIAGGTSQHT